ncbi:MAG: glycosyltransferase family 1 protein [Rhodospirillales bacterium]|jgi:glycosyltransferase involved in cell wall biosynthesis|nr:glycosyltransferase family 1 protein [Rhodospirillales bacterium]
MRLLIATDAWLPQINGVVRTFSTLVGKLSEAGHDVRLLTPETFPTLPCPSYPEIRLAVCRPKAVSAAIEGFAPEAIHIATEGPLGWAVRRHCLRRRLSFSTSFHTRFPEYIQARWRVPLAWSYRFVRAFHAPATHVMVATASIERELVARGFRNISRWTRGVDTQLFHPRPKNLYDLPRPVSLYVGRIAVEKSVEDFLRLDLPGSKVLIGDGPMRAALAQRYPQAHFLGAKTGEDLAAHYAAADVFVFPSRTDTFGLVLLEALASGVPVAAYPVPGPLDVVGTSGAGCLDENLAAAVTEALAVPAETCRARAEVFSWDNSVRQFLANITPLR